MSNARMVRLGAGALVALFSCCLVFAGCSKEDSPSGTTGSSTSRGARVAPADAGASDAGPVNTLCTQQYALCTSAPCVPAPLDPTTAMCSCDVENGKSMSTKPCDQVQPSTDANGIRTVYSAFSLVQFMAGEKGMVCPSGSPWTWCLDMPCTVDPANPKKAVCACKVMRTGQWMTAGGDCNTSTCGTAYWSGATLGDLQSGTEFMMNALGLTKSPVQWCPGVTP